MIEVENMEFGIDGAKGWRMGEHGVGDEGKVGGRMDIHQR